MFEDILYEWKGTLSGGGERGWWERSCVPRSRWVHGEDDGRWGAAWGWGAVSELTGRRSHSKDRPEGASQVPREHLMGASWWLSFNRDRAPGGQDWNGPSPDGQQGAHLMGSHLQPGDRQAVLAVPTLCAHICSLILTLLSYQVCVTLAGYHRHPSSL